MICKLCGGELFVLNILGRLLYLQCRDCGMQFSQAITEDEAKVLREINDEDRN